jgi:3-methyladenine DNA glycosylase AlkD
MSSQLKSVPYLKAREARSELQRHANPKARKILQSFFKTGPGEYGEGDHFIGVQVPFTRKIAANCKQMPLSEVRSLLRSPIHEERLLALIILVLQFKQADLKKRQSIYKFYVSHLAWINNWDLVDTSAEHIVGGFLAERDRQILTQWAQSRNLWKRRISILSTFHFIRKGDFKDTLRLARLLLHDSHDLIHKAVGWLLREVGKKDRSILRKFLDRHAYEMPRTMLRYSIERLTPAERKYYMGLKRVREMADSAN